jgi:hypothetical protein
MAVLCGKFGEHHETCLFVQPTLFLQHVVIGIMSDDKTSLPMLLPGFVCLCTAIIFGPVS